jgi:hypothetical protein
MSKLVGRAANAAGVFLGEGQRYRFSGHQTFPFRYPWLPKAVQGISKDPSLFFQDDAMVRLGVGRNMVASMRFWCESLGLASFDGSRGIAAPSDLAVALFLGAEYQPEQPEFIGHEPAARFEEGRPWDPYLEDVGTLWLLHWKLASSPTHASTWHLVFTRWYKDTFTREEIVAWLAQMVDQAPGSRATLGTLRRDVDTFIRTYATTETGGRRAAEDSFDCPLVELGLLRDVEGANYYQFVRGAKPTLPIGIFTYALLDYWAMVAPNQGTLNFERILYGPGSPGAAFKLSESALVALLEQLEHWAGAIRYDETAGLRAVIRQRAIPFPDPLEVLVRYYDDVAEIAGR